MVRNIPIGVHASPIRKALGIAPIMQNRGRTTAKLPEPRFKGFGSTDPVQKFGILRKRLETQGQEISGTLPW
jgi:hypothetical protein